MMKWTQIKVAAAVAVIVIGGAGGLTQLHRAAADNTDSSVQQPTGSVQPNRDPSDLDRLLRAVQANDRETFLKDATPAMRQGITAPLLDGVSKDLAPHLSSGYTLVYFGELRKSGDTVEIWKLSFKDGRDDALVKMAMSNRKLDGFFIQ
jgi:hypothetical protein